MSNHKQLRIKPRNFPGPMPHIKDIKAMGYHQGEPSWIKWRHQKKLEQKLERGETRFGSREKILVSVQLANECESYYGRNV